MNRNLYIYVFCLISLLPFYAAMAQVTALDDVVTLSEDGELVIDVQANDLNFGIDPLITSFLSFPVYGTLELLTVDSFRYTPFLNYNGIDTFSYTVCNSDEPFPDCDEALVIITVLPLPDFPLATNDTVATNIETPVVADVQQNDINLDAESLVTNVWLSPEHGVAVALSGDSLLYTPETGFIGPDSLAYTVCKIGSSVYCDTAWLFVEVLATNFFAPLATDDVYIIDIGVEVPLRLTLNDSDLDGDSLFIESILSTPMLGSATVTDTAVIYLGYTAGIDTFEYRVCDYNTPSWCDTAMVQVEVLDIRVPDSFSPNGDGFNEMFKITGLDAYPGFQLKILNRWGQLVYETSDPDFFWRGEVNTNSALPVGEVVDGTYFYILELNNGFPPLSGSVVLLR